MIKHLLIKLRALALFAVIFTMSSCEQTHQMPYRQFVIGKTDDGNWTTSAMI